MNMMTIMRAREPNPYTYAFPLSFFAEFCLSPTYDKLSLMIIMGIETSCDESAIAVLRMDEAGKAEILYEEISSQVKLHEEYGGVVPELASREHLKNLPLLFERALDKTGLDLSEIDLLGVTRGPGLKGCVLMGVCFARGVALAKNVPLLGVNHIEGHLLAACLDNPELEFPLLALIVSGGHTELVYAEGVGSYKVLARTIDDAAGEAFDKSAHLMNIPYPGGPKLAGIADQYHGSDFKLPKVMREAEGFSFSGLKTAISLLIKKNQEQLKDETIRGELCWAIQDSIVDALVFKLKKAIKKTGSQRIVVAGGVSANRYLRKQVQKINGIDVFFPDFSHCTDNAAMIAYTAGRRKLMGERENMDFTVESRWPIERMSINHQETECQ